MGPEAESRTSLRELKPGDTPEGATWYTFAPLGESPCARVGHNCLYVPPLDSGSSKGKVVLVGGANPNGSFSDVYFINLDEHRWTLPHWEGLLPRYEHSAFIPASQPTKLWVFGGANVSGNRNCLQVLDLQSGTWESPKVTGTPPSPRTYHTSTAAIGDQLFIFGGGDKGADPVQDQHVHIFDSATLTWQQADVQGNPPAPRHGHAVAAFGPKLFIHGGLAGDTFYSDLYCIDTRDMKWEKLLATGSIPRGRAAHSAAVFQGHLYIFGGMDPTGALDSMYKYQIEKGHWTHLEFKSPLPSRRLDHAMCIVSWEAPSNNRACEAASGEGAKGQKAAEKKGCLKEHLCLVFGGMDMRGELYKDCVASLIQ